jgi:hypothetical protein
MANDPKGVMRELQGEIAGGLHQFTQNFIQELRVKTPIRTGRARGGWVQTYYGTTALGRGGSFLIAYNNVPYIGVLDGLSPKGYTSSQAPKGIVEPAFRNTRRR